MSRSGRRTYEWRSTTSARSPRLQARSKLIFSNAPAMASASRRCAFEETRAAARKRGFIDVALCRLTVLRSRTDTGSQTVYLTPSAVRSLITIRPVEVKRSASIFGLSPSAVSRHIKAAAVAALRSSYSGHSRRMGMARRMAAAGAPTHEIMAQGRWKTLGMVETYTRGEKAGRAGR